MYPDHLRGIDSKSFSLLEFLTLLRLSSLSVSLSRLDVDDDEVSRLLLLREEISSSLLKEFGLSTDSLGLGDGLCSSIMVCPTSVEAAVDGGEGAAGAGAACGMPLLMGRPEMSRLSSAVWT